MDDLISLRDLEAFAALPKLPNLAQPSKFEPELPDAKRVLAIRTQEHPTPPTLPVTPIENVLIGLEGAPGLVSGFTFWQREQRITPQAYAPGGFVTGSPAQKAFTSVCPMAGGAPAAEDERDVSHALSWERAALPSIASAEPEPPRCPSELQTTAGLCLMRGMLRRTSPANHTPVVLKSYALMVWSWVKRSSTEQLEEIVALAPPYEVRALRAHCLIQACSFPLFLFHPHRPPFPAGSRQRRRTLPTLLRLLFPRLDNGLRAGLAAAAAVAVALPLLARAARARLPRRGPSRAPAPLGAG